MATWADQHWTPTYGSGLPRRERQGGRFRAYVPDVMDSHPLTIDRHRSLRLAEAENAVRRLGSGEGAESLAGIARFLLRSEAIASSRIEGITPSPQQVALAELAMSESIRGVHTQAQLVANNMTVVARASEELVHCEFVTVEHIVGLHDSLLPDDPRTGLRTVQNWIGGSNWNPIDAAFVPPPAALVPPLIDDLIGYLNGATHSPVLQAALVHAQFETIHPFTDGNGRVGRALIHTVLTRRGLLSAAVLPVSLVLATLGDRYVDGLSRYRYQGSPDSPAAITGIRGWVDLFVEATIQAADVAHELMESVDELRTEWTERIAAQRVRSGVRSRPRGDSATARLLALLPEAPIVTARTLQRILGISHPTASAALEELAAADVLHIKMIERGTRAFIAREILDLITLSERQLASTRFDTSASPPNRGVPAPPPL